MNDLPWVSLIALTGWLILTLVTLRTHQLGGRKAVRQALTWLAVFALIVAIFSALGSNAT